MNRDTITNTDSLYIQYNMFTFFRLKKSRAIFKKFPVCQTYLTLKHRWVSCLMNCYTKEALLTSFL